MLGKICKWFTPEPPTLAKNAAHAKDLADAFRFANYMKNTMEVSSKVRSQIHRAATRGEYHLYLEEVLPDAIVEGLMVDGYEIEETLRPSEAVYDFTTREPRLELWTKITWGKDA